MKKDYIMNDKKVRQCDANTSKMNIFEYVYFQIFHWSYFKRLVELIWECLVDIAEPLSSLFWNLIMLFFTPISILIFGYFDIRRSRHEMNRKEKIFRPTIKRD